METALKNIRHEKFCQLYAGKCYGNATQAYKLAGYRPKTDSSAAVEASRMLRNVKVFQRIEFLRQENYRAIGIDRVEILEILTEIARGKLQDFVNKSGGISIHGKKYGRAVESIQTVQVGGAENPKTVKKIKLRSPVEAIDRICKIVGFDKPVKVEHEHKGTVLVIQ